VSPEDAADVRAAIENVVAGGVMDDREAAG
jgi:hypothetical protein